MKKLFLFFIFGVTLNLPLLNAFNSKLKLDCRKTINPESKNEEYSKDFPVNLFPCIGEYLKIDGLNITFTSNKKDACNFEIEDAVTTTLGTVYYRITYKGAVLVWNEEQKQFELILPDRPLGEQIQWHTLLKWFSSQKTMSCESNSAIQVVYE